MKLLITGGTGFVGKHLVDELEKEHQIILPVRDREKIPADSPNITVVDFPEDLSGLVEEHKPDCVVNLLGILNEQPSKGLTFEKVHVDYTKQLVEGSKKAGVKKFLQMSALGSDGRSKSRYARTKAEGERLVMESGINYLIFRPSIILGKGQKLFEDLKKFSRLTPVLLAPKGKVQPVHIDDVVKAFKKGITDQELKNTVVELCGTRIVSYKELFEFALSYIGRKRLVIEMPPSFFRIMLPLFRLFPEPPMTEDQLYLLERDNVCTGKHITQKDLLGQVKVAFKI
ncbi:MAG: complex I NDUFA9 subunit family protein [Aquificae bacterium]|nr:complex I NDUFA9 subunit family protein [Aquificota bacterium]